MMAVDEERLRWLAHCHALGIPDEAWAPIREAVARGDVRRLEEYANRVPPLEAELGDALLFKKVFAESLLAAMRDEGLDDAEILRIFRATLARVMDEMPTVARDVNFEQAPRVVDALLRDLGLDSLSE